MKKLSEVLKLEEKNDAFLYFKVVGSHTDPDRDKALAMCGLDGRETFIRVMLDEGKIIAVTCWYTARIPENTLTFYFTDPDPLLKYMHTSLTEALKELQLI